MSEAGALSFEDWWNSQGHSAGRWAAHKGWHARDAEVEALRQRAEVAGAAERTKQRELKVYLHHQAIRTGGSAR